MFEMLLLLSIALIVFSQFLPDAQTNDGHNKRSKIGSKQPQKTLKKSKTKPHRKKSGRAEYGITAAVKRSIA